MKTFGCLIHVRPPGLRSKRFKDDTRQGIFLGYVPHTDRLFTWYDEGTHQVKIATHAKFDEGFNDLPIDTLPPNCQHILCLNGQQIPINERLLSPLDLEFFIYPFANSETAVIDYNPKAKDNKFGFQLLDDDLTGRNYIYDIKDKVGSSAARVFGSLATTRQKLCGCFITHINDVPVFSTDSARAQLQILYKRFKKRQEQGVDKDMNFKITFARAEPMDGKKLKQAIDDYHDLTPGTTKRICDKYPDDDGDDDGVSFDLGDRTKRFNIGFPIYKVFDNKEYKEKIIEYDYQR